MIINENEEITFCSVFLSFLSNLEKYISLLSHIYFVERIIRKELKLLQLCIAINKFKNVNLDYAALTKFIYPHDIINLKRDFFRDISDFIELPICIYNMSVRFVETESIGGKERGKLASVQIYTLR